MGWKWIFGLSVVLASGCSSAPKVSRDTACLEDLEVLARVSERSARTKTGAKKPVGLTRKQVLPSFERLQEDFHSCYAMYGQGDPGKFVFAILVGEKGTVEKECTAESNIGDASFHACMLDKVRSARFPVRAEGPLIKVTYPVKFVTGYR